MRSARPTARGRSPSSSRGRPTWFACGGSHRRRDLVACRVPRAAPRRRTSCSPTARRRCGWPRPTTRRARPRDGGARRSTPAGRAPVHERPGRSRLLTRDGERLWHTLDVRTGELETMTFAPELLEPGSAARHRRRRSPYANRYGMLVRFGRRPPGWELPVAHAITADDEIWIQHDGNGSAARGRRGARCRRVSGGWSAAARRRARPPWDGRGQPHGVDIAADGAHRPAGPDVWQHWPDLQIPRGPAVTDAGEIDLAIRTPDGLQLIRIAAPQE